MFSKIFGVRPDSKQFDDKINGLIQKISGICESGTPDLHLTTVRNSVSP